MSRLNRGDHKDTTPRGDRAMLVPAPHFEGLSRFSLVPFALGLVAGFLLSAMGG